MRSILPLLLFFIGFTVYSQQRKPTPQETVMLFFEAFHLQDTLKMKTYAAEGVVLKSISKNPKGEVVVQESSFNDFLISIKNIPAQMDFKEQILDYKINDDGLLSTVWTPYEFYINGKMSHCGVNNFQLLTTDEGWKIISIVDTRKKTCKN